MHAIGMNSRVMIATLRMILFLFLSLFVTPPPAAIVLDAGGVSFTAPIAGVYCVNVYAPEWAGDARHVCDDSVQDGQRVRLDVPIAPGAHVFVSRVEPGWIEVGPITYQPEPPPLAPRAWLPIVGR
jgi:hypothetical protein